MTVVVMFQYDHFKRMLSSDFVLITFLDTTFNNIGAFITAVCVFNGYCSTMKLAIQSGELDIYS